MARSVIKRWALSEHIVDSDRTKAPYGHYWLMSQSIAVTPDRSSSALSPEVLKATAKIAKLRYVSDRSHGIRRERSDGGFDYIGANGAKITNEDELTRIRKLAIPPAYQDVWICPYPNGHIQATGRDARGPNNIAIIRAGEQCGTKASTARCSSLARCCQPFVPRRNGISRSAVFRGRRFWRPSYGCWRAP
jgi:hypothetical protein